MEWQTPFCGNYTNQVMTDEQMEVLRRQIAAYAAICEQLVEMHKSATAQRDTIAAAISGMRIGGPYSDSLLTPSSHKITGRQRWTPTSMQLQVLEKMFDRGTGTPSKQRIKEIALELSHHGQISEANVYNWFQNRRARTKRKQTSAQPSHSEPETDADDEPSTEKKLRAEKRPYENLYVRMDDHQLHIMQQANNDLLYLNSEVLQTQETGNFSRMMDSQGSYIAYQSGERSEFMH